MKTYGTFKTAVMKNFIRIAKSDIDCLHKNICDVLENASKDCIPSSKIDSYRSITVPGFNEFVKELHTFPRHDYIS